MSELNTTKAFHDLRWRLLATVSALALASTAGIANADDGGKPVLWIELGAQAERMPSVEDGFAPPFSKREPRPSFETDPTLSVQRPPRYDVGGEGKLTFEPGGSNWIFTASVRYGRSNGQKHVHDQFNLSTVRPTAQNVNHIVTPPEFADTAAEHREAHTILDFTAGKDVGLGMFGNATANLGVRYAQFGVSSAVSLSSRPDYPIIVHKNALGKYIGYAGYHSYTAKLQAHRNFHGIGPSLSFNGDVPVLGHDGANSLTFDWGINGAVLFGRQRATVTHNVHGNYKLPGVINVFHTYDTANGHVTSRSVTVPNIGGLAGISYRFPNAKLSLGYRADFFLGAMDKGLDARESATMGFHGPFATVSIGLGG